MKITQILPKRLVNIGFLAAACLSANLAMAQDDNPGPKFGVKGGINLSQLYVDQPNAEDENIKVGYHFGVFGKIPVADFIALQPELLYTNVGSKINYGGSNLADALGIEEGEVRFNLGYVRLPVLVAFNIGAFNIHAGPYVAYLTNANVKDLESSDLSTQNLVDLDTDDFNRFDYGLSGGIGFDVKGFTIGARYNYGLREIGNGGLAGRLTNDSKNSAAEIYIGFGGF